MATATAGATSNTGTGSVVLTRSTAAGSTLVVGIQHPGGPVTSVVDSAGNTWKQLADSGCSSNSANGTNNAVGLWYCSNAAAVTTVTINGTGLLLAGLVEITGVSNDRLVYSFSFNYQPASASVSGGAPTSANGDYVLMFGVYTSTVSGTRQETTVSGFGAAALPAAQAISGTAVLCCAAAPATTTTGNGALTIAVPTSRSSGGVCVVFAAAYTTPTLMDALADVREFFQLSSWTARRTAWVQAFTDTMPTTVRRLVGQIWPRGDRRWP